jgi:hypothetical protein
VTLLIVRSIPLLDGRQQLNNLCGRDKVPALLNSPSSPDLQHFRKTTSIQKGNHDVNDFAWMDQRSRWKLNLTNVEDVITAISKIMIWTVRIRSRDWAWPSAILSATE